MSKETFELVDEAVRGDKAALESLINNIQDFVYNLALRMLGTPSDAEDATQEIIIKVITQLSTFRKESKFTTWVYRIAANYLIDYKKSMFAQHPLSFEIYAADIENGFIPNSRELLQNVDENLLAEELKQSCTNVMLQCLDAQSRMIFVLGVMFQADSKVCGEILKITPEAYRQRLSRIRKRVAEFLSMYCGLSGTGKCNCKKRVGFAIQTHRLQPENLEYSKLQKSDESTVSEYIAAMEEMDRQSLIFAQMPKYRSPESVRNFISNSIQSEHMEVITAERTDEHVERA